MACPPWRVTFHLSRMLPWAWQEEAVSLNIGICGPRESDEDVDWVRLCVGCVNSPIQEMRLAVAWAALYSGLVDVCSVWSCWFCVLLVGSVARLRWPVDTRLRIGVPEALGGARVY